MLSANILSKNSTLLKFIKLRPLIHTMAVWKVKEVKSIQIYKNCGRFLALAHVLTIDTQFALFLFFCFCHLNLDYPSFFSANFFPISSLLMFTDAILNCTFSRCVRLYSHHYFALILYLSFQLFFRVSTACHSQTDLTNPHCEGVMAVFSLWSLRGCFWRDLTFPNLYA